MRTFDNPGLASASQFQSLFFCNRVGKLSSEMTLAEVELAGERREDPIFLRDALQGTGLLIDIARLCQVAHLKKFRVETTPKSMYCLSRTLILNLPPTTLLLGRAWTTSKKRQILLRQLISYLGEVREKGGRRKAVSSSSIKVTFRTKFSKVPKLEKILNSTFTFTSKSTIYYCWKRKAFSLYQSVVDGVRKLEDYPCARLPDVH